jgi:hypothetical protein
VTGPDDEYVPAEADGFLAIDHGINDDEKFDWIDCGLGPDGQCSQAGTEYCDFDCGRLG